MFCLCKGSKDLASTLHDGHSDGSMYARLAAQSTVCKGCSWLLALFCGAMPHRTPCIVVRWYRQCLDSLRLSNMLGTSQARTRFLSQVSSRCIHDKAARDLQRACLALANIACNILMLHCLPCCLHGSGCRRCTLQFSCLCGNSLIENGHGLPRPTEYTRGGRGGGCCCFCCILLQLLVTSSQPPCNLLAASLQPHCNFLAASCQPPCSLLAAPLQASCSFAINLSR